MIKELIETCLRNIMNEIAEYKYIHQQCNRFNRELVLDMVELSRMRAQKIGILFGLPGIVFAVLKHNRDSRKIIKKIREGFHRCTCDCTGKDYEAACMKMLTDLASDIRDHYYNLNRSAAKVKLVHKILGKGIQDTLIEWDDLVEDLTIGSDQDIRSLLAKIASAA